MRKIRKLLLITICLALCLFVVTACNPSIEEPSETPSAVEVKFVLNGELYAIRYPNVNFGYTVDIPAIDDTNLPYRFLGWYDSETYFNEVTDKTQFMESATVYGRTDSIFKMAVKDGKVTITGLNHGVERKNLVIPDKINGFEVDAIGYNAFENSQIESVHFESGIVKIHDEAFKNSKSLDTVTFGENSKMSYIGDSVFRGCEALANITLPDTVESVGELTFYGCSQVSYGELYSKNPQVKEYYSPKYTYEFLGEDVMPIGGYIEPSVGYFADNVTLERVMKEYVESGCNIVIGIGQLRYGTTAEHYKQMFEYLSKYGGMMFKQDSIGNFDSFDAEATESVKRAVEEYAKKYPSFAGYHIEDEPGVSSWVPGLGEYSRYTGQDGVFIPSSMQYNNAVWKKNLGRKLYFVNLLPVNSPKKAFAFGADNYSYGENTNFLWGEYEKYANYDYYYKSYIENVKPEVFSYDFYPLWANGTSSPYLPYPELNNRHFEQLYMTRYYAEDYSLKVNGQYTPFWNFIQIAKWSSSRAATESEVLWQINTAFAYGSKGYQYFVFNDYGDIYGNGAVSDYAGTTPVNIDGTINEPVYRSVQKVNGYSQAMAKWLLNANVDHLYLCGENPNNEDTPSPMFVPRDSSIDWAFKSSEGVNHIVSHMTYYANNNQYDKNTEGDTRQLYFVCNNNTQSIYGDGEITINFDREVTGRYILRGEEKVFAGNSLTVQTYAGEGFAILLNK